MKKVVVIVSAALLLGVGFAVHALNRLQNNRVQLSAESELNGYTKTYPVVVVMISAEGCRFCKVVKPIVEQLTREMKNVMFVHVDADNKSLESLVNKLAPDGYPEIKIYKNGQIIDQLSGSQSKTTLENVIKRYAPLVIEKVVTVKAVAPLRAPAVADKTVYATERYTRPRDFSVAYDSDNQLSEEVSALEDSVADLEDATAELEAASDELEDVTAELEDATDDSGDDSSGDDE